MEGNDPSVAWIGEPCWLGAFLPHCWMADFPVPSSHSSHSLLREASHPEDFGCITIWLKSQDNSILVQGPSKIPDILFGIMHRNVLYLEIRKNLQKDILYYFI